MRGRLLSGGVTGGGIEVDGAGNIYVDTELTSGTTNTFAIQEYGPTASGGASPTAVFSSTSWNNGGSQIALK